MRRAASEHKKMRNREGEVGMNPATTRGGFGLKEGEKKIGV